MSLNNLSEGDRKKGLEKARLVRKKRAGIKSMLKEEKIDINKLFKDNELFEEYISNMKVLDLVSSLPGNGRVNALKILKALKISPNKRVGGLGKNQRRSFYQYFKIN
jgi:guanylate kinase